MNWSSLAREAFERKLGEFDGTVLVKNDSGANARQATTRCERARRVTAIQGKGFFDKEVDQMSTQDPRQSVLVLTAEDVAGLLQVPVDTVENLHRTRQLAGVKVGKHLRWLPEDVVRFVEGLGRGDGERQNR